MALFATVTGSNNLLSYDLNRSLAYLSAHSSMTLFSLKNVNTSSTQTVFNPDGHPVADIVELTLRSSSIGGQNVHCKIQACMNTSMVAKKRRVKVNYVH